MDLIYLGKKLKEMRKEKGLTQEQAARKIGISRQTLSKMENGWMGRVTVLQLNRLLRLYGYEISMEEWSPFITPEKLKEILDDRYD